MKTLEQEIIETALLEGKFILRSGRVASQYLDKYPLMANPGLFRKIVERFDDLIAKRGFDLFGGIELGGVPIATALSLRHDLPCVSIRKARKEYGTQNIIEGMSVRGKRVCLVEDVVTTGGQAALSAKAIEDEGGIVDRLVCIIMRGDVERNALKDAGIEVDYLFHAKDLGIQGA